MTPNEERLEYHKYVRVESMMGENNPRWNGGTSEYPDHYTFKLARRVCLEKCGGICAACPAPATTVHHKDGDKANHALSNLVALCSKCHFRIHAGRQNKPRASAVKPIADRTPSRPLGRPPIRKYGFSVREIAEKVGVSVNCAHDHLIHIEAGIINKYRSKKDVRAKIESLLRSAR